MGRWHRGESRRGLTLAYWGFSAEVWMWELELGATVPDLCPRTGFGCSVSWSNARNLPSGVVTGVLM